MIQEKRGMLKVWNASLVLATGILAVLGTFLVRSGILDSIHAFGASTLGTPFLIFIAVLILGSTYLVATRVKDLRTEHRLDSLLSREAAFLLNNLVLVGMAFVVFWGTFFPLISEAVTGNKASVGPPWFDRYIVPLAIVLVLLTGIGPVIAWRRQTWATVRRSFLVPLLFAIAGVAGPLLLGVDRDVPALLFFFAAAFSVGALGQEFWRGTAARRAMTGDAWPVALGALVRRNRRRYGGYVVHLGIVVMFLGVAASSTFQHARDVRLQVGGTARIDGYDVKYVRATSHVSNEKITFGSVLAVSKDGKPVTTLRPSRNYFPSPAPFAFGPIGRYFEGEATSEVGLRAGGLKDLWAAMTPDLSAMQKVIDEGDRKFEAASGQLTANEANGFIAATVFGLARSYAEHPPPATFRLISSPMVTWIWTGGLILLGGALIAMWPAPRAARRRVTAAEGARLGQELGRA
jgi:cytochrome c-type biogenesis protein CcmF